MPERLSLENRLNWKGVTAWLSSNIKKRLLQFASILMEANSDKESPGGGVWLVGHKDRFRVRQTLTQAGVRWVTRIPWARAQALETGVHHPQDEGATMNMQWHSAGDTQSPGGWHGSNAQSETSPLLPLLHLQATGFRRQSVRLAAHQERGHGCESQPFLKECWSSV